MTVANCNSLYQVVYVYDVIIKQVVWEAATICPRPLQVDLLTLYRRVHQSRGIGLWLVLLIFNAVIGGYLQMR